MIWLIKTKPSARYLKRAQFQHLANLFDQNLITSRYAYYVSSTVGFHNIITRKYNIKFTTDNLVQFILRGVEKYSP